MKKIKKVKNLVAGVYFVEDVEMLYFNGIYFEKYYLDIGWDATYVSVDEWKKYGLVYPKGL